MGSAGVWSEDVVSQELPSLPGLEPIILKRNSIYGFHIVATRLIKSDEIIVEEFPLMVCPCTGHSDLGLICLTCFKICTSRCSMCSWPVCGYNCERGTLHSELECPILSKNKVEFHNPNHDYTAIKVLRCLLLQWKDVSKWNYLLQHDAQLDKRNRDLKTKEARDHVLHFILDKCQLQNAFDSLTVQTVLGICAINEFCLMLNDYSRNAFLVFHKTSYLTHSCKPNLGSVWKFHPTQDSTYAQDYFSVKFFAVRDIEMGEVLTHSYMPETFCVRKRQSFLAAQYYFDCNCERCREELPL